MRGRSQRQYLEEDTSNQGHLKRFRKLYECATLLLMNVRCRLSQSLFEIRPRDEAFYASLNIPFPTLCPDERMRRRLCWRNERHLYKRVCDRTGRSFISNYHPSLSIPIYSPDAWWSDEWDALEYGQEYVPTTSFETQFFQLFGRVPRLGIVNRGENSTYCNFSGDFKNSYMCISGMGSEDCLYCHFTSYSQRCVDCSNLLYSQFCYECIDGRNLYECSYCQDCSNSRNLQFCKNCEGCEECFCCVGLYRKRHYVFNKQVTPDEYRAFIERHGKLTRLALHQFQHQLEQLSREGIYKFYHGFRNEAISGDYIYDSRNVEKSFDIHSAEDAAYCHNSPGGLRSVWDSCYISKSELICECISPVGAYEQVGCMYCWDTQRAYYSDHCFNCHDVIGCVGLRHQQYCIFNKRYEPEEYHSLAARIFDQMRAEGIWGEFFSATRSPFAYNESIAAEYFPLTSDEVRARGFVWREDVIESGKERAAEQVAMDKTIDELSDSCIELLYKSHGNGRPYRITKQELSFFRDLKIPLPEITFDERHLNRLAKRNPRQLWKRTCCFSGEELLSSYAPHRHERIAGEEAYGRYFYGG
jgi:hypothetical protein